MVAGTNTIQVRSVCACSTVRYGTYSVALPPALRRNAHMAHDLDCTVFVHSTSHDQLPI